MLQSMNVLTGLGSDVLPDNFGHRFLFQEVRPLPQPINSLDVVGAHHVPLAHNLRLQIARDDPQELNS